MNPTVPATTFHLAEPSSALRAANSAEWTKFRTLRTNWITLAVAVVAAVALGVLNRLSDVRAWDDMSPDERLAFDPVSTTLIGVLFGALVLGAIGVRAITSEYASGMIRNTIAAIPQRRLVLAAKVVVTAGLSTLAALAANLAGFLSGQAILRSEHLDVELSEPSSARAVVFGALAVGAFAAIGVGLGALVKRAAVANVLMSLVVIGGQLVGTAMPTSAQRFLPFNCLQATVTINRDDSLLAPLPALLLIGGYAAAIVGAGVFTIGRRDV